MVSMKKDGAFVKGMAFEDISNRHNEWKQKSKQITTPQKPALSISILENVILAHLMIIQFRCIILPNINVVMKMWFLK